MVDRFLDWKKQLFQTLVLVMTIFVVCLFDMLKFIIGILEKSEVKVNELSTPWRIVIGHGRWVFAIALFVVVFWTIRKANKDAVLKQNLPQRIVWHSYAGYWFCCKILNYQKLSLSRVPIPMQFKLVWKNLFQSYECMEGVTEIERGTDRVEVMQFQNESITSTVNLVLADTYPLDWRSKLPASVLNLTTLVIDRSGVKGVRYYSPDFVARIANTVHELPKNVIAINVFATINSAHCYHIVKDVFVTGGRDCIRHLNVFEQSKDSWVFEEKYLEIF